MDDLTVAVVETASGSSNAAATADLPLVKAGRGYGQIAECSLSGVSSNRKITTKAKLVLLRSVAECDFLDDVIELLVHGASF
jgi:hypothetical protein